MTEQEDLKLFFNFLIGEMLGRPEVTAARIVDDDIKVTSFRERGLECFVN